MFMLLLQNIFSMTFHQGQSMKKAVSVRFSENRNSLSSLLMKDLLYSSLTVFLQAVFAFTKASAKTL